jgi:hypothetical protein
MKTFQILNDALIYSIITSEQYIKLESKNLPTDWSRFKPPIKMNRNDILRYYIMLMETGIYTSEYQLKIYESNLINGYADNATEYDVQPPPSCYPYAT